MDPYNSYGQHSNPSSVNRQQALQGQPRAPTASVDQGGLQSQQQLPSFKEILPPPLQSAIEAGSQYSSAAESHIAHPQHTRPGGAELPFPNYSQSSSMPDSFDDFGQRGHEAIYQTPIPQRHPTSANAHQQFPDMATSYGTYRPQFPQQQLGMRSSPGLPPFRDIDQGFSKLGTYDNGHMSTNGYQPMFNQPLTATPQYAGDGFGARRDQGPSERNISQTYPPASRPYPPIRSEPPYGSHSSFDPYSQREHFGYPYAAAGMSQPGPMYPSSEAGDSRNRRRRGNLPKPITDILRAWFQDHLDHPYPTEEEKAMFIQQTGLSQNQISNWFINARRRHLPALRQARDSRNQGHDSESQHHHR